MIDHLTYQKAALLAGCCFFMFLTAWAQDSMYFFTRYGERTGSYEVLSYVGELNHKYVAIATSDTGFSGFWKPVYCIYSLDGELESAVVNAIDSVKLSGGWYGAPFEFNGRLVGSGDYAHYGSEPNPVIYRFDEAGELDSAYVLHRDSFNVFSQGKLCDDQRHFVFAGVTHEFDPDGDYYVVKTDTNAQVIWEKTYGTSRYDYGLSIDQSVDEGYFIYGSSRGYGLSTGFRNQGLLIKTDSMGIEEWRRHWGGGMTSATGT